MLYECIECKHKISADAWRCPNCGCKDAGELAELHYLSRERAKWEFELDRKDPGWRERRAAAWAAKEAANAAEEKERVKKKIFLT